MLILDKTIGEWAVRIEKCVQGEFDSSQDADGSHDLGHLQRVSRLACRFAEPRTIEAKCLQDADRWKLWVHWDS